MKEWIEALYVAVILALADLRYLVSFPRYGRLKKKCQYKQICNGTYWLLLTGHFGPVFIRPSQWSITAVKHQVKKTDLEKKLVYKNSENIYLGKKKSVLLRRPIWSHWLYCGTQSTAWKSYRVTSFYNLSVYNTLAQMYDDCAVQKTWLFCIFLLFYTIWHIYEVSIIV